MNPNTTADTSAATVPTAREGPDTNAGRETPALQAIARWLPVLLALPFVGMTFSSAIVAYDDHVTPCQLILEHGALPAVDACWECHQPPIYYAAAPLRFAVARAVTAPADGALPPSLAFQVLKLLGLLFTLGTVTLLASLTRRFFPAQPAVRLMTLALVLTTPRFVLGGVMMGNDAAVLFFATLTLWLTAGVRQDGERQLARYLAIGAACGAAVLAKYNAFALVPAVGAVPLWAWWRRQASARVTAWRVAALAVAFLTVTGPWFIRNVVESGTPIPTRMARAERVAGDTYSLFSLHPLDLLRTPSLLEERIQPGETLPYRNHQVLTPADTSLWTKTYALWWADGLYYFAQPPAWQTVARWLAALPVCLVALLGALVAAARLLRRRGPSGDGAAEAQITWVAPVTLIGALLVLYFAFVARYPWVALGHGRAVFLLPLAAPFALSWGVGYTALTEGRPAWLRAVLLTSLGVTLALSVQYEVFLLGQYL